jgi:hypothetical protein
MVRGHYYISTATENIVLATADPSLARSDVIVLRLDPDNDEIVLAVVTGTPGSGVPTLTQTETGVYELPLATVAVAAGAGVPGTITDRREFMGTKLGSWTTAGRPEPAGRILFGFNTDLNLIEVYDGTQWRVAFTVLIEETTAKTANYTLAIGDLNKVVPMNGSTALTLTVPTNATVAFPIGSIVNVYNQSSSAVTVQGASGVTVRNGGQLLQFKECSLRKRATNEWVVAGGLL